MVLHSKCFQNPEYVRIYRKEIYKPSVENTWASAGKFNLAVLQNSAVRIISAKSWGDKRFPIERRDFI